MFKENIVTIEHEEVRYYDVTCDGCEKALKPAWGADENGWHILQADEGISIRLSGNYPQHWDNYTGDFIFCDDCLNKLRIMFPLVAEQMDKWLKGASNGTNEQET